MTSRETQNRRLLTDLFSGHPTRHAIIMDPPGIDFGIPTDYSVPGTPIRDWLPIKLRAYEEMLNWSERIGDDSVPYVRMTTNTGIFASAFGCAIRPCLDSLPCAVPMVRTAEEADALSMPDLNASSLSRFFEMADMVREDVGPEVPIGVPDIQSAFDIAALVWNKEDMFVAMHENPDAVKRLADKCQALLKMFFDEFRTRFPENNPCHCPTAWAPPELGCWLSEDEAGSLSTPMFEEFCLPYLIDLSESYGGLSMHSCAAVDHQYGSFNKIPNLRGLNRVFQKPGSLPAIRAFSGKTVLVMAWVFEADVNALLDMAQPDTRFLFNIPNMPFDDARRLHDRLRARIG